MQENLKTQRGRIAENKKASNAKVLLCVLYGFSLRSLRFKIF
jgi:hypothetical protein